MREIFVIYDKATGFIDGGSGRIDREWDAAHKDGSTMSERIPDIVAKKPNRAVIYFPERQLPEPDKHKIANGKIVKLTSTDIAAMEAAKPKTEIEMLEERIAALEGKKGGG